MEKDGWIIDNFTMISDEIKEKKDEGKDKNGKRTIHGQQRQIQSGSGAKNTDHHGGGRASSRR